MLCIYVSENTEDTIVIFSLSVYVRNICQKIGPVLQITLNNKKLFKTQDLSYNSTRNIFWYWTSDLSGCYLILEVDFMPCKSFLQCEVVWNKVQPKILLEISDFIQCEIKNNHTARTSQGYSTWKAFEYTWLHESLR